MHYLGENRKKMLLALGFTGATACMLFLLVFPSIYFIGSLLTVVSITCMGSTFVLLNSFLPLLVSNHPSIRSSDEVVNHAVGIPMVTLSSENDDTDSPNGNFAPPDVVLIAKTHTQPGAASPELKLSNQISSKGVGISYAAAVFVQIVGIVIVITFSKLSPSTSKSTIPMRVVLFLVGLWWAVFTIPSALWLRPRPGPPLPPDVVSRRRWLFCLSYIAFAWTSLWKTIKVAVQLREVVLFLIAWFLLSDAIATISGTAILFARTELQMGTAAVAGISIVATSSGIAGAFSWPIIGRRLGLESRHIIITCIVLFEIIPIYGLSGFIPFIRAWGVGGLQQPWEIFPMAFIHGFVMGGLSSYCRSFFGMLIPPGSEAAFYALFAITDKGSSVIGPAIVGHIIDVTGSIRLSFWFLVVLMILPAPLVWLVDVERGRKSGIMMAEKLRGRRAIPVEDREERHEQFEEREELLPDRHD
jgi:MFS transporter, UMF1 family